MDSEVYFSEVRRRGPSYMGKRLEKYGMPWSGPSPEAREALPLLLSHRADRLLDVGCGYGRDTLFFASHGFNVMGVDFSKEVCALARRKFREAKVAVARLKGASAPRFGGVKIVRANFTTWKCPQAKFGGAFSFKTLHQFRHNPSRGLDDPLSAAAFVSRIAGCVQSGGILAISSFSTRDHNYGKGEPIEEDTFATREFRPCAFYTLERFIALFREYTVLKVEHLSFDENHEPDGHHWHGMWMAIVKV